MVSLEAKVHKNKICAYKIRIFVVKMAQQWFTRTGGQIFMWRPSNIFWGDDLRSVEDVVGKAYCNSFITPTPPRGRGGRRSFSLL